MEGGERGERREERGERREKEREGCFSARGGGEGFAGLLGGYLPGASDPWCRRGSLALFATFSLSCSLSFLRRFFDAIFDASWLDVPSQLAPKIHQNPSKTDAKMPSHVDLIC